MHLLANSCNCFFDYCLQSNCLVQFNVSIILTKCEFLTEVRNEFVP